MKIRRRLFAALALVYVAGIWLADGPENRYAFSALFLGTAAVGTCAAALWKRGDRSMTSVACCFGALASFRAAEWWNRPGQSTSLNAFHWLGIALFVGFLLLIPGAEWRRPIKLRPRAAEADASHRSGVRD